MEEAQNEGKSHVGTTEGSSEEYHNQSAQKVKKNDNEDKKVVNEHSVSEISEDAKAEEVVKKQKETSDYFNTIVSNEPEHKLIRAIVDEDVKAVDGSRVRLRLLDDIDIGDRTIAKGNYLYCTLNGFGQQRVKGTVNQNMNINDGSSTSSTGKWGMQALQNAYQKAANASSKNIRKNKVKVKYGTQVYLVNSREKRK